MSPIKIDLLMKRGDFLKFYGDVEQSEKDYEEVIRLCEVWTGDHHNMKISNAAHFSLGKLLLRHFASGCELV